MNYTSLSLPEAIDILRDVAREAQSAFARLDGRQLNWRPSDTRWSVAQCLEHLVTTNGMMVAAANRALKEPPTSLWQRVPLWPRLAGRMLIRSQTPGRGKYTAPPISTPSTSNISVDVVARFVAQHAELIDWMSGVQPSSAQAVMLSPFFPIVAYSVMDGCRLLATHDRRHVEQARRVMTLPSFPSAA